MILASARAEVDLRHGGEWWSLAGRSFWLSLMGRHQRRNIDLCEVFGDSLRHEDISILVVAA
jgi:hypothetical protein